MKTVHAAIIVAAILIIVAGAMLLLQPAEEGGPCPEVYAPVCGADGVTYGNSCFADRAGVSVAYDGVCEEAPPAPQAEVNCTDTDSGKDSMQAGSASNGTAQRDDSCSGGASVEEYFCEGGAVLSEEMECPQDHVCDGGRCVPEEPIPIECTDSDGTSYFLSGTVSYSNSIYFDYCVAGDTVREYVCTDGNLSSIDYVCPPGNACVDGRCGSAAPGCTDTDGGNDEAVKGTASNGTFSDTDYCSGSDIVEFFCSGDDVVEATSSCKSGTECVGGACVPIAATPPPPLSACTDTDGGQDPLTKGSTSDGSAIAVDSCSGSSAVNEFYCSDSGVLMNTTVPCPTAYWCIYGSGACTAKPPCVDNDGGQNIITASTAVSALSTYYDSCIDSSTVSEALCDANEDAYFANITCPSGTSCSGGACLYLAVVACTDSDGGVKEDVLGTVIDGGGTYTDTCAPTAGWVREYFCANSTSHSYYDVQCAPGKTCVGGICK